jgi:hypothetical protein
VADLVQQLLHQACPAEAVGIDDEGQFAEQVGSAQLMSALIAGQVCSPAVVGPACRCSGG